MIVAYIPKPRHDTVQALLAVVAMVTDDACPPNPALYMCTAAEHPDEDICRRCWQGYALWLVNGEHPYIKRKASRPH